MIKVNKPLDVIVTSTCRRTIEKCIPSFLKNVKYNGKFRFLVNIDVKDQNYLPRLRKFLDMLSIDDVNINMYPKSFPTGHTEAINCLYNKIKSPYYFNLEDDWIFKKKVELDYLIILMKHYKDIHHFRFNKECIRTNDWLYHISDENIPEYCKANKNVVINGIKLVKIHTWSFNPSLSRSSVAKKIIPIPPQLNPEKYFCHKIDEMFKYPVTYMLGHIGDKAIIKDIGRPMIRTFLRTIRNRIIKWKR